MSGGEVSIKRVKLVRNTFVFGFVFFWAMITSHCGLENIPGFSFLACESEVASSSHQPSDCGDSDSCDTVESGHYKTEDSQQAAGKAPFLTKAFVLVELSNLDAIEPATVSIVQELAPPELSPSWQFHSRTALPPRAPSLLS